MRWPAIEELYGPILRNTGVFGPKDTDSQKRWEDLHTRVIEHVSNFITQLFLSH